LSDLYGVITSGDGIMLEQQLQSCHLLSVHTMINISTLSRGV